MTLELRPGRIRTTLWWLLWPWTESLIVTYTKILNSNQFRGSPDGHPETWGVSLGAPFQGCSRWVLKQQAFSRSWCIKCLASPEQRSICLLAWMGLCPCCYQSSVLTQTLYDQHSRSRSPSLNFLNTFF